MLCLDAIKVGVEQGGHAGLKAESAAFAQAASLDTHKALVHIFFAQRATKKVSPHFLTLKKTLCAFEGSFLSIPWALHGCFREIAAMQARPCTLSGMYISTERHTNGGAVGITLMI